MKLTAEDYERHYREISDEEFLAIDRDDLVDLARRCYDAELARRQLAPQAEPEDAVEPEDDHPARAVEIDPEEDLVQVGVLTTLQSATYVQKLLQDADIPSDLVNQTTPPGAYAFGTIALMVPVSCVEEARDLLAGTLGRDNQVLVRRWFEKDWTPDGMDLNDFVVTIDDVFGEEDKVAVRLTVEGVNTSTGRDVKVAGVGIVQMADGKIAETWIKLDQ